jgi:hypothetical protein
MLLLHLSNAIWIHVAEFPEQGIINSWRDHMSDDPFTTYIQGLYYITNTVTAIGVGDPFTRTHAEMITTLFLCVSRAKSILN